MRRVISVFCAFVVSAAASHALLIDVVTASNTDETSPISNPSFPPKGFVSTDGGTTTGGVFRVTDQIFTGDASPTTLGYTLSGLDIDGVGGDNDNVVISFIVSTDGQVFEVVDDPTTLEPRNAGWISSGGALLNADGEFVQVDFSSLSVNLNGGIGNGSGSFDGFTSARAGGFQSGEVALINGNLITQATDGNVLDLTPGGNDPNLQLLFDSAAGSVGNYRPESWSFQITAIPEPTTLGTMLIFGSAMLLIRKRRAR